LKKEFLSNNVLRRSRTKLSYSQKDYVTINVMIAGKLNNNLTETNLLFDHSSGHVLFLFSTMLHHLPLKIKAGHFSDLKFN